MIRTVFLKELIKDIRYGFTGSATWDTKGVGFIRVTDIDDRGEVNYHNLPSVEITNIEADRYFLEPGDCVFARSGSVGKLHVYKGTKKKTIFASYMIRVKFDNSQIEPYFFGLFSKTANYWKQIETLQRGGVQQNLNTDAIGRIRIPLPPLPIQKQIAAILEKADAAREKRRKANELTEQFLQSAFLEMFGDPVTNPKGWEMKRLGETTNIIMGQSPIGDSYNNDGFGTPLLNGPTEFGLRNPKEKQWTKRPTKLCQTGDILFCVRGATAGRMNWADKEYCIGRGLAAIRSENSNEFIYSFLLSNYHYFQSIGQGSTFINISKDILYDIRIPFPPIELQSKFSKVVEKIQSLQTKQRESEQELDNLFNSLMQKAFKGELVRE